MSYLNQFEKKVISQNGEDGIIEALFKTIGVTNKYCIEIGFGQECNTGNLLSNYGWNGLLIDCDKVTVAYGADRWGHAVVLECFVEPDIIDKVLDMYAIDKEPDLLSIDIDGCDYHVWNAIKCLQPRAVAIEYNASFGDMSVTVPYKQGFNRMEIHPYYHGASLKALTKLANSKGYGLVAVDSSGINCFFVKQELIKKPLIELNADEAYYPHYHREQKWQYQIRYFKTMGLSLEEV